MKVKHLIKELQKCDPELSVITEGCDCQGDTFSLDYDSSGDITICRSDYVRDYKGELIEYENDQDTPEPIK